MSRQQPRRRFPILLCAALTLLGGACNSGGAPQRFTDFSLGTVVTITFYAGARARNAALAERLFAYATAAEMRMSTSQGDYTDSELLRSNRQAGGGGTAVSADTLAVVAAGIRLSRLTGGDFQVGIWPLTQLWDLSLLTTTAVVPDRAAIAAAVPLVGHAGIAIDHQRMTLAFAEAGMGVDVGGIAKGWVADYFRAELLRNGVQRALIDIGGNIVTVGERRAGKRWQIGVQNPHEPLGEIVGVLAVTERAVVTAGNYERFVDIDGERYHHIIDPATGFPAANELSSVTIVTASATDADALSTALYVKGLERGWQFVQTLPAVEALFITADKRIFITAGLDEHFTLRSDDFTRHSSIENR